MELIKLLRRIEENYEEVKVIELENVLGDKHKWHGPRIYCNMTLKDENDKLIGGEDFTIDLDMKVETIVEKGQNQGYNKKGEPIVVNTVLKPFTLIANELIAMIEAIIDTKEEMKENNKKRSEALEEIKVREAKREKQIELNAKKRIESLEEGEVIMPKLSLIEMEKENE